ncbi:MAG: YicC/YloC family endoribonuclease [Rubripirellula sp.]
MSDVHASAVRSMTGQGHASAIGELGSVQVEIRTVNSRGFKCVPRLSDILLPHENQVEALVRNRVHRGTVHLSVTFKRPTAEEVPSINPAAMDTYLIAIQQLQERHQGIKAQVDLASLFSLPGVLNTVSVDRSGNEQRWDFVQQVILEAIDHLDTMRSIEGHRMSESLEVDCHQISQNLEAVRNTSPRSVDVYRQRLQGKIERTLEEHGVQVSQVDLLREVQIYADRVDIHEEIVRLGSHLKMFASVLRGEEQSSQPTGRKLDFILQEMFRETNTIGSKASDAEISTHVVEIKCAIERMRELVQNLE